jgi:uncharacterized membrane protein
MSYRKSKIGVVSVRTRATVGSTSMLYADGVPTGVPVAAYSVTVSIVLTLLGMGGASVLLQAPDKTAAATVAPTQTDGMTRIVA